MNRRMRKTILRLLATVTLVGGWGGCRQILGITDHVTFDDAGGAGAMGSSGSAIPDPISCNEICRSDLKAIINECTGEVLQTCTVDQGCSNQVCIDNPCQAATEARSSLGCDYWALKTAQRAEAQGACFAAIIANTWEKPVHISVERPGTSLPPIESFASIPDANTDPTTWPAYDPAKGLDVGQVAILFLSRGPGGLFACPRPVALATETGVKDTGIGNAFHITTDYPVVAYQITPYGGGMTSYTSATLLIPTSAWDTQYMAINAYKASSNPLDNAIPSMNIVAELDGTEVTITPSADIVAGTGVEATAKGVAKTYPLNAGQFLQITQQAELTGSSVKSNLPVGFFGASTCMFVPDDTQKDCDPGQQQIAPLAALGNEYVAIRYKNRTAQEESPPWRLVGGADDTRLTWEPQAPQGAPEVLKSGEVVEFFASGPFIVKSQDTDHAFYLGSYMTGGAPFMDIGDPEWVNVTPPGQYLSDYVFFTDPTYPETSLTVVRTPSKDPMAKDKFADVELECLGKLTNWQPIGKYEYTRVDLVSGNFVGNGTCTNGRQKMTSALPFGVTVWGWGTSQQTRQVSYAYTAGAGFRPIKM
jgi:hypothetical protein